MVDIPVQKPYNWDVTFSSWFNTVFHSLNICIAAIHSLIWELLMSNWKKTLFFYIVPHKGKAGRLQMEMFYYTNIFLDLSCSKMLFHQLLHEELLMSLLCLLSVWRAERKKFSLMQQQGFHMRAVELETFFIINALNIKYASSFL